MKYPELWNASSFNIAAALICISGLYYSAANKLIRKAQNRVFIHIIAIIAINAVCATTAIYAEVYATTSLVCRIILFASQYLYFIAHTFLALMFLYYSIYLCDAMNVISKRRKIIITMPAILAEVFVLLNPVHHLVYYFDENYAFHRGDLEMLLYVLAGVYAIGTAIILIKYWETVSFEKKLFVVIFYLLTILGIVLQMISREVRLELFCESLAMMGFMFALEDETQMRESITDLYNRATFINDVERYIARGRRFDLTILRLRDASAYQRLAGAKVIDKVPVVVAEYLRTVHPFQHAYRVSPFAFAMVSLAGDTTCKKNLAGEIEERFGGSFDIEGKRVHLSEYILSISVPKDMKTLHDILLAIDTPIPASTPGVILKKDDLKFLLRSSEVGEAIMRAMEKYNFTMEYMPIYHMPDMSEYSVEACISIDDIKLGKILPAEFQPVAEANGTLEKIGEYLINNSFAYFAEHRNEIKRLNVDLYSALWLKADIGVRMKKYLDKYGLDAGNICLEITESAVRGDKSKLGFAISELKELGFSITLDDYGAGYSNIQSMFALDFDQIKLGRSLLQQAGDNEVGAAVLEGNVDMIKRMGLSLLADGIENSEQEALTRKLGIDFAQGEYLKGGAGA